MFLPRSFDFNMEALAARLHVGSSNDSVMGRACALYEENRAFFDQGLAAAVPVEAVFDGTSLRLPSFDVPLPETLAAGLSVGPWKMFLFACTAGDMLCRRIEKESRPAAQYLLEVLSHLYVEQIVQALAKEMAKESGQPCCQLLCPGSLPGWDIAAQKNLFALLPAEIRNRLPLSLSASGFLLPRFSLLGLGLPGVQSIQNCAFCARPDCPTRRAAPAEE